MLNNIKEWLTLYEIFLKEILETFRGKKYKTYQKIVKKIILNSDFCSEENRHEILNAPKDIIRLRYLLETNFDFSKEIQEKIIDFIEKSLAILLLL